MTDYNMIIEKANNSRKNADWKRFNSCNAWIADMGDFSLIKSYDTIVGLADHAEQIMYEFGKYSMTTSKQFTQICNQIFRDFKRINIGITNW